MLAYSIVWSTFKFSVTRGVERGGRKMGVKGGGGEDGGEGEGVKVGLRGRGEGCEGKCRWTRVEAGGGGRGGREVNCR